MSAIVRCDGCGSSVEREQVVNYGDHPYDGKPDNNYHCDSCTGCTENPKLREAYRRGFNAGVDAMAEAVVGVIEKKNELKR